MAAERGGVNRAAYTALELALRVGELMLGGGEAADTVELAMARLARAYGLPHCEISATLSAITVSYLPRGGRAPVTAERRVRRRQPNYTRLVAVHLLVDEAAAGRLDLRQARFALGDIIGRRPAYPGWVMGGALALIGAAGSILVGGGAIAATAAFVCTAAGDRAAAWLGRRGVAEFFQMATAGAIAALVSVLLVWSELPTRAETVIIGVVIALIPGRSLVAALQDGITGDVDTGTSRLAEVLFLIIAVLSGIAGTLYVAARLGLPVSQAHLPTAPAEFGPPQLVGSAAIAAGLAVHLLAPRSLLVPAAVGGVLSWTAYVELRHLDLPPAPATAIATTVIGVLGTAYARARRVPALVCVVPCVAPLMPGTLMYRALLDLTGGHPGRGALILVEAMLAALAIGAGVNMGAELVRVIRPARERARRRFRPPVPGG